MRALTNFKAYILATLLLCASSYIRASQTNTEVGSSLSLQPYTLQDTSQQPHNPDPPSSLQGQTPLLAQRADSSSPLESNQETSATTSVQDYRQRRKNYLCSIGGSSALSALSGLMTFMGATSDDFGQTPTILWCSLYGGVTIGAALYSGYHCVKLGKLCCQSKNHL